MLIGPTLGRYFSRRFTKTIFLVFATVFTLVYTLDFVELMRRAGDAEGASAMLMAQLALFRTPAVAEQVMPFAVLFGSMAALLQLSRKLELVVARAAGISAWQFLQPGLFVAAMIGVLSVSVYNPVSAYAEAAGRRDRRPDFSRTPRSPRAKTSGSVRRASTSRPSSGPTPSSAIRPPSPGSTCSRSTMRAPSRSESRLARQPCTRGTGN